MMNISDNIELLKPASPKLSRNQNGLRSSKRSFHTVVILCLLLLSVFLMVGLISLCVIYRDSAADFSVIEENLTKERDQLNVSLTRMTKERDRLESLSKQHRDSAADLSAMKENLTERLQASNDELSSMTKERHQLNVNLTKMTEERDRLQSLSKQHRDSAADLSAMKKNLTERLQASNDELSSMTKERHQLNVNLTEMTEERDRLQSLSKQHRDSAADFSVIKKNLTERLQASNDELSSMTKERDQLNVSLTRMTKERDRLESLSKQRKTCPAGWSMFSCTCYLLSTESGSWIKGREDCQARGADLVVINSAEEQTFLSTFAKRETWIGLNDRETEGTWIWVDGTPLTLSYWTKNQPDNGGKSGRWGEEDCAHIRTHENTLWNDISCEASRQWICEEQP